MSHYIIIQAVAGIFTAVASIIAVSIGPITTGKWSCDSWCNCDVIIWSCDPGECEAGNVEYSALGYFLSAVIVIIICLVSFIVMIRMVISN